MVVTWWLEACWDIEFCVKSMYSRYNLFLLWSFIFLSSFFPCSNHWVSLYQGIINFTSTYDSGTRNVEGSLVAKGDLWRVEASQGSSTSGNENSSLFLIQLGPILFVRDSTLLLPVHLSKRHLLWYGYDRKVWQTYSSMQKRSIARFWLK